MVSSYDELMITAGFSVIFMTDNTIAVNHNFLGGYKAVELGIKLLQKIK